VRTCLAGIVHWRGPAAPADFLRERPAEGCTWQASCLELAVVDHTSLAWNGEELSYTEWKHCMLLVLLGSTRPARGYRDKHMMHACVMMSWEGNQPISLLHAATCACAGSYHGRTHSEHQGGMCVVVCTHALMCVVVCALALMCVCARLRCSLVRQRVCSLCCASSASPIILAFCRSEPLARGDGQALCRVCCCGPEHRGMAMLLIYYSSRVCHLVFHLKSGQVVGVGSGSTVRYVAERLGQRVKTGELSGIVCVPTSFQVRRRVH
jgi:hypothetical protein